MVLDTDSSEDEISSRSCEDVINVPESSKAPVRAEEAAIKVPISGSALKIDVPEKGRIAATTLTKWIT